ncbi:hypothetical protein DFJ74DRAFT_705447 [Hyaloraphidium curvatum]|nr:hypothetical protein DFJ74DRAFT_705447 [Hyaloraphidium curvatum]
MAQRVFSARRVASLAGKRGFAAPAGGHAIRAAAAPQLPALRRYSSGAEGQPYAESPSAFPWLVADSPARPVASDLPSDPNPIRRFFQIPLARFLSRNFAESVAGEVLGKDYLQTTMLLGAEAAVQRFVAALSAGRMDELEAYLQKPLLHRLESELERLKARNESVSISIPRVHDITIRDLLVVFGPAINMAILKLSKWINTWAMFEAGATNVLLRWLSLAFVIPKTAWLSKQTPTWQMIVDATEQGGVIIVDCEIDAEVEFSHRKDDGEVIFQESRRRPILLQLSTKHLQVAANRIRENVGEDGEPISQNPSWRISDVDNLLQSTLFQSQMRKWEQQQADEEG